MKGDVLLGVVLGLVTGMAVATYCKDAQNAVKKGTDSLVKSAKKLTGKTDEE